MEMSIREAKAKFSEAIAAAERGEAVIVTRHGKAVAQISQPPKRTGLNFAALEVYKNQMGWEDGALQLPDYFDDPAFSRKVLGLKD